MNQLLDDIASQTMRACYQLGYCERETLKILRLLTDTQLLLALCQADRQEHPRSIRRWLHRWKQPNRRYLYRLKQNGLITGQVEGGHYRPSHTGLILCREVIPSLTLPGVRPLKSIQLFTAAFELLASENGFKMLKLLFLRPWSMPQLEEVMGILSRHVSPLAQRLEEIGLVARSFEDGGVAITLQGRRVYLSLRRISKGLRIEGVMGYDIIGIR